MLDEQNLDVFSLRWIDSDAFCQLTKNAGAWALQHWKIWDACPAQLGCMYVHCTMYKYDSLLHLMLGPTTSSRRSSCASLKPPPHVSRCCSCWNSTRWRNVRTVASLSGLSLKTTRRMSGQARTTRRSSSYVWKCCFSEACGLKIMTYKFKKDKNLFIYLYTWKDIRRSFLDGLRVASSRHGSRYFKEAKFRIKNASSLEADI